MSAEHPFPEVVNSTAAKLEMNARPFSFDAHLDRAADLFDTDPQAWLKLSVDLQDQSGIYRDLRASYRRATAAGVIPDDRSGPNPR